MNEKTSPDYEALKKKVNVLAEGLENKAAIEEKLKRFSEQGIRTKKIDPDEIIKNKEEVLDRVQKMAEAYEQVSQSCAKSSALAVMEEFGLGNIEVDQGELIAVEHERGSFSGTWICSRQLSPQTRAPHRTGNSLASPRSLPRRLGNLKGAPNTARHHGQGGAHGASFWQHRAAGS